MHRRCSRRSTRLSGSMAGSTSCSIMRGSALRASRTRFLCPAAVETPLLDQKKIEGLETPEWIPNIRRYLERLSGPPYPADKLAEEVMAAVERNRGIIVIPGRA